MSKKLGAIYTPDGHARILATWAIRSRTDLVLDMGIGHGIFVYRSYERLRELGAGNNNAANQIYGSEINSHVFKEFTQEATKKGLEFSNLQNANFFEITLPQLDAVVGNPPYVRRRGMSQRELNLIRSMTLRNNSSLTKEDLSSLSDLYIYFLFSALPYLKPGGRLATIVADSWLNTRYGVAFKKYLLNEFDINQIIGLDRSVFEDAQVKAVLLLASKKSKEDKKQHSVKFARVRNGLPINELSSYVLSGRIASVNDIFVKRIKSSELDPKSPWGAILKSTATFDQIKQKDVIKKICEVADCQIGLETLAKNFFAIPNQANEASIVEKRYLKPFAYSVYDFNKSVIDEKDVPVQYLFYCAKPKSKLVNTKALKHILLGEKTEVHVRGTSKTVVGYHNKDRIRQARRPRWYDVKTECDKKEIAEILLPRFIYKDYKVLWNIASYIPGGAVVQFFPKVNPPIDIKIYLAVLESSFTEIAFRINAQMYGGGTSNLRVSAINESPIIDPSLLTDEQKSDLVAGYNHYLKKNDKSKINRIIYEILGLTKKQMVEINELLIELRNIAESTKKAAHPIEK
ncbi:MAG: hypothetical protein CNIPEHKO_00477 [Anaerolineales bacterium]|nr:hypothetical protein [Anaerolineales bacterium]